MPCILPQQVEVLGRMDRQLKINGVRMELAEVEAALAGAPGAGRRESGPWDLMLGDLRADAQLSVAVCQGTMPAGGWFCPYNYDIHVAQGWWCCCRRGDWIGGGREGGAHWERYPGGLCEAGGCEARGGVAGKRSVPSVLCLVVLARCAACPPYGWEHT